MRFIRANKLSNTKVQYLPSIRDPKSRNLLFNNGTVDLRTRRVHGRTKFR
jgi:hypothetical protein